LTNTEYRLFYRGKRDEEWSGTKAQCENAMKFKVERQGWDATKFEIKGGFKPRKGFNL